MLVDPGPESTLDALLAGLDGQTPRAVLLTHIHFDHAGAAGALVGRFPGLPVYVHSRGAPHLADPRRLVSSATRLYGEDGMRTLWGEVVAVPESSLHVLEGGETVLGEYRVAYTPGHASHHVCFLHEPTGWALTGDVAGVCIPPLSDVVVAPTPPPDIDLDAWERSLAVVEEWAPERLGITHFGEVDDPPAQIAAVREALARQADWQAEHDQEGFEAAFRDWLTARSDAATAAAYLQAAPAEHLYKGLERWRAKVSS